MTKMEEGNEFEETYVYFDFGNVAHSDFLKTLKDFKLLGLGTDKPLLQLEDNVFQGIFDTSLGTNLFFSSKENEQPEDKVFSKICPQLLTYECKADKLLKMQRVIATQKIENLANGPASSNFASTYAQALEKLKNSPVNKD